MPSQVIWEGDATAVTQVTTQTIAGTWANLDTITTTLEDENGQTDSLQTSATGSDIETQVRDIHLLALQASAKTLFKRIDWTSSSTDKIVATMKAKYSGEPFILTATESTAGSGTHTTAITTANVGPNDYNSAPNWSTGSVPVADDIPIFNKGSVSVLFGLNQSAVDLQDFMVTPDYYGDIGDAAQGFPLRIKVSNVTTSTTPTLSFAGSGAYSGFSGQLDNVIVSGLSGGPDSLHLAGVSTTSLKINGERVKGTVTVEGGSFIVSDLSMHDCPLCQTKIGTNGTAITSIDVGAGLLEIEDRDTVTLDSYGSSRVTMKGTSKTTSLNARTGSFVDYRAATAGGTEVIGSLKVLGGIVRLGREVEDTQTITNAEIHSGEIIEDPSGGLVVYTNDILYYGGRVGTVSGKVISVP